MTSPALRRSVRWLRWRLWLAERLRPTEPQVTLFWAAVVGFLGALSSIGFRVVTEQLQVILTRQPLLELAATFERLQPWERLAVPAGGGLIAGVILWFGARRVRGGRSRSDYMEAVVVGDGVVPPGVSLVRCASASFSIASGGSIGREGPIVQLAAMLASLVGRTRRFATPRLRLLVGCGAAAGIASAYNAPIAGALFVSEILLGTMAMEFLGPLVLASCVATITLREILGPAPLYDIPMFTFGSAWQLGPYLLLGLGCGLLGAWFLKVLRLARWLFGRLPDAEWLRLPLGGLIVGALAIYYPQVCGNGYGVVNRILHEDCVGSWIAMVLAAKILATCATFGSGAVGGVFTPTLLVGAAIGALLGQFTDAYYPGARLDPGAMTLVGMGAFLAATTRAPMMATIMLFELTHDYKIILPLMLDCVLATQVSVSLERTGIYGDAPGRAGRQGIGSHFLGATVASLMKPDPVAVRPITRFSEVTQKFIAHNVRYLYVTTEKRGWVGAIALHDVKNHLNNPELADLIIAHEILHAPIPTATPAMSLLDALKEFGRFDGERLPVLEPAASGPPTLVGYLSKTDAMLALADAWTPVTAETAKAR